MESATTAAKDRSEGVRTDGAWHCYPAAGYCPCGAPLTGRQKVACKPAHRAKRHRRQQGQPNSEEEMLLRVVIGVLTDRLNKVVERRRR